MVDCDEVNLINMLLAISNSIESPVCSPIGMEKLLLIIVRRDEFLWFWIFLYGLKVVISPIDLPRPSKRKADMI